VEEIYKEKKAELIKKLFDNTIFDIDHQPEYDQIAVWCETFGEPWSICFQNGDMNGMDRGCAIWTNSGANSGLDEIKAILEKIDEFEVLVDHDTAHPYLYLDELINDFICEYDKKENFDQYFEK